MWLSLRSMGGDGKSAMEKVTDTFQNCQTAVEYNTIKPTNNLNDELEF
jgi:hypothetical protein